MAGPPVLPTCTVWLGRFQVAGDGDLGGVIFSGGGVWDDVVDRPLIVWGLAFCV